ncbi:EAL domain-containing protein [Marinomonas dokdonensis]|uniref:EAL domain-containing protein n=1 Tax=Marinomonas dokdonensis TaxID=328224 RepID=UPI0040554976
MAVGITKNNQLFMSFLSKSFAKANFFLLFFSFIAVFSLTFFIAHILIINNEIEMMHNYSYEIMERTDNAGTQLKKVLQIADSSSSTSCSKESLDELRGILSHHYLIEDAGVIKNYKIACTAKIGVFETPKFINPALFVQSAIEKVDFFMSKEALFYAGERRSLFKLNDVFVTLAPNLYIGIDPPDQHTEAILVSSIRRMVFRGYNVSEVDYEKINRKKIGLLSQYAPFPNRRISVEKCSSIFKFCVNSIDNKIGIYGVNKDILLLLIGLSILLSYTIFISMYFLKSTKETMKYRLSQAIKKNNFYPLYQPKIDLKSGKVVGVEALARWQDEKLGFVAPDVFIALAEEMKVIKKVTKSITKLVLDESQELLRENTEFTVSINLSVQDLAGGEYLNFIESEVDKLGICRRQVILEITERSATESDELSNSAHEFYEKGYQISLDDFGTGFCNLSWLSKLESNEIKIDRMFTHSISTKSVGLITLDSLCNLLEKFHMKTVFEGIETQEELEYILSKSPNAIGQGWLFAKAMSMTELKSFIASKPSLAHS